MPDVRNPPAYQRYASDRIADERYVTLSLAERGLVDAMEMLIWCNGSILADAAAIALFIRRPEAETREALTTGVLRHFEPMEGDPSRLVSTDLRRQWNRLMARRAAQSDGGRAGADKTNRERSGKSPGNPSGEPPGEPSAPEQSSTEPNGAEQSGFAGDATTSQPSNAAKLDPAHVEFVYDYDQTEEKSKPRASGKSTPPKGKSDKRDSGQLSPEANAYHRAKDGS